MNVKFITYFQNLSPGLVETKAVSKYENEYVFIKPEDVANAIKYIISQPETVHVSYLFL